MVNERVRICFIGCGLHSMMNLQPAVTHIPMIDYVAACDLVEEKAKEAVRRFGAKEWYTDYNEMIDKTFPDGVIIVGHPQMHQDIGISCLKRGLNVFIEKPPSLTVEGAKKVVEAMKASGRICQVGTMWRHMPIHKTLKKISENPDFGEIYRLEATYLVPEYGAAWELTFAWGFMLNQAIHLMDCIQFLGGRVAEVNAEGIIVGNEKHAIIATLKFASGALGSFVLGGCTPIFYVRIGIQGTGAWAESEQFNKLRYVSKEDWIEAPPWSSIQAKTFEYGSYYMPTLGYREELEHFAQCILSGGHPHADAEDAYNALRILHAIVRSAETNEKITINYEGRN